ncbi:hypothetical protein AM493_11660 [Flavobacterium akiainvivens]|uniref:Multidrug transporter n=1 Tax=Flavobacterium akiainvivens TaxID=1202724 RepID=A0A0M8MBG5_9FLAO|nr:hypothetical protein [Flavobacterium akiainvivens]KOS06615.1 hypothetical protein AM493_11660 [Flavobacterium akiainvivens]SFQ09067.1 hypothetical protein SAMN05444144_10127 [Flavobacterium akiainvivens]
MKKSIVKILALASLSFALVVVSCSDDDTATAPSSSFVINRDALQGDITDGVVTLESGTYKLTAPLFVRAGAKLVIKPGVIIEATTVNEANPAIRYIAVAQGGQIDVQGTASSPVVMTSTAHVPGSWGGLVLCGSAPINKGASATAEVGLNLTYGGTNAADNSGSIKYLRVEYPGYAYNSEKEFNGVSFFGVGNGTVVENIEVYQSSDDGFEWFGGTVNTKNLVVFNSGDVVGDDLFDWTEGWNGTNENWYGKRTNGGNRGIEADNNSNDHVATPISNPNIKNLTLIGAGDLGAEPQAIKLRVGTKAIFDNVVLSNFKTGFDVQHNESVAAVTAGQLKATNVKFDNVATKAKGTNTAGETVDVNAIFTESTTATGAGNGTAAPTWAQGWTTGI